MSAILSLVCICCGRLCKVTFGLQTPLELMNHRCKECDPVCKITPAHYLNVPDYYPDCELSEEEQIDCSNACDFCLSRSPTHDIAGIKVCDRCDSVLYRIDQARLVEPPKIDCPNCGYNSQPCEQLPAVIDDYEIPF